MVKIKDMLTDGYRAYTLIFILNLQRKMPSISSPKPRTYNRPYS